MKVDDTVPVPAMSVSGQPVAKVRVETDKINVEWLDGAWADWKDLHDSAKYTQLKEENNKRLTQAAEYQKKKGNGKGKAGTGQ